MTDTIRTPIRWTRERAAFVAVGCLMAGFAGGWSIHGARIGVERGAAGQTR